MGLLLPLTSFFVCAACILVLLRLFYGAWLHQREWTPIFMCSVMVAAFYQLVCVFCYFRLPYILQRELDRRGGIKTGREWTEFIQILAGVTYVILAVQLMALTK